MPNLDYTFLFVFSIGAVMISSAYGAWVVTVLWIILGCWFWTEMWAKDEEERERA